MLDAGDLKRRYYSLTNILKIAPEEQVGDENTVFGLILYTLIGM